MSHAAVNKGQYCIVDLLNGLQCFSPYMDDKRIIESIMCRVHQKAPVSLHTGAFLRGGHKSGSNDQGIVTKTALPGAFPPS